MSSMVVENASGGTVALPLWNAITSSRREARSRKTKHLRRPAARKSSSR